MARSRNRRKKAKKLRRERRINGIQQRGLREDYIHAQQLAENGQLVEATALYQQLLATHLQPNVKALVLNDLASLKATEGELQSAIDLLNEALSIDRNCKAAQGNLAFLKSDETADTGEQASHRQHSDRRDQVAAVSKVAVLSFLFNWPSTGGGIVHTVELCQYLIKAGYHVNHFYAQFLPWGIGKVEGTPPFPSRAIEFEEDHWNIHQVQQRFRKAVQEFDPDDVIVTDSWNTKPLLAEAVSEYPYILRLQAMECLCPLNNVRLLPDARRKVRQCPTHQLADPEACAQCVTSNGSMSGSLHQAERSLAWTPAADYRQRLYRVMRQAKSVLVVNPLHQVMVEPYAADVRVVTAGMDPARFPLRGPNAARRREKITFLFAGLVQELMKGFHVLLEAGSILWRNRQDFVIVATGHQNGEESPFVRFVGWQSQDALAELMCESDVLVMPSIAQEALGRSAVEGMAAGIPVIASRLGGLQFTVVDGATGVLFEPGNANELADKMQMLMDDSPMRERLGTTGRKRFEEHYSWDVIIDRHYRPLLGKRKTSRLSPSNAYAPQISMKVDQNRLISDISDFFHLPKAQIETMRQTYRKFHEAKEYAKTLGELKTLCFDEAFILYVALSTQRPRVVVEIGTQYGKSTRRILDARDLLGLDCPVVCFDVTDQVDHFDSDEAELVLKDITGRFRTEVLEAYPPGLLFVDVHSYALLKEIVTEILANNNGWLLALHDCGPGLCNPIMRLAKDDPNVTSLTGIWERHVLAEAFQVSDPLSASLDCAESVTHRMRIFVTPHGLGVIQQK